MLFIALPSLETILGGSYGWLLNSSAGLWEGLPSFCLCLEPRGLMWFYVSFCFEAALLPAFVLSGVEFGYLAPGMKGKLSWSELLLWQKRRRCVATVLPCRKTPSRRQSEFKASAWSGVGLTPDGLGAGHQHLGPGTGCVGGMEEGGGRPKRSSSGRIAACPTGGCTDKTLEPLENNCNEVIQ